MSGAHGTWQQTGGGGGGGGLVLAVIGAAILLGSGGAAIASAIVTVVIALLVTVFLCAAGVAAFLVYRARHPRAEFTPYAPVTVHRLTVPAERPVLQPQRQAIGAPVVRLDDDQLDDLAVRLAGILRQRDER
jgi:hypothetical protein